jgi:hypothetical protein
MVRDPSRGQMASRNQIKRDQSKAAMIIDKSKKRIIKK